MNRATARDAFEKRIGGWAKRLDVQQRSVTVRGMRNKWASCSTAGRLTFDELVPRLPHDLQDYVIVHELLHLKAPNHGKLWKSLMRAYLGDYEGLEARLKRKVMPPT